MHFPHCIYRCICCHSALLRDSSLWVYRVLQPEGYLTVHKIHLTCRMYLQLIFPKYNLSIFQSKSVFPKKEAVLCLFSTCYKQVGCFKLTKSRQLHVKVYVRDGNQILGHRIAKLTRQFRHTCIIDINLVFHLV